MLFLRPTNGTLGLNGCCSDIHANARFYDVSFRKLTVNDVVSMLEDENDFQSADIFMDAPSDGDDTGEDSGEEEGGTIYRQPAWETITSKSFRDYH